MSCDRFRGTPARATHLIGAPAAGGKTLQVWEPRTAGACTGSRAPPPRRNRSHLQVVAEVQSGAGTLASRSEAATVRSGWQQQGANRLRRGISYVSRAGQRRSSRVDSRLFRKVTRALLVRQPVESLRHEVVCDAADEIPQRRVGSAALRRRPAARAVAGAGSSARSGVEGASTPAWREAQAGGARIGKQLRTG